MRRKIFIWAGVNLLLAVVVWIMCLRVFGAYTSTYHAWRDALGRAERANANEKVQYLYSDYAKVAHSTQQYYLMSVFALGVIYAVNGFALLRIAKDGQEPPKQASV